MTAPLLEQFSNGGTTTLNGSISDSDTTITVTSSTPFPSTGNFRLVIESEILLVTAVSGSDFTVVRGYESTAPASHADTTAVSLVLTSGSVDRWGGDNIPAFGYPLPYGTIVADDGSTVLTASSFGWVNQGSATVTDQSGTILMSLPTSSGVNLRGQTRAAPSTPYAYVGAFQSCIPRSGSSVAMVMMGFRNSSNFRMETFICGCNGDESFRMGVQQYATGTSSGTQVRALNGFCLWAPAVWLRVADNGTNLIYSIGMDGKNWIQVYSASRTSYITSGPDQVFWGGVNNSNTSNTGLIRLVHFSRES